MPQPLQAASISDAVYNGSDTNTWTMDVYTVDTGDKYGTLNNGAGYSVTATMPVKHAVKIVFNDNSDPMAIAAGETITLTVDGNSVDVYLPDITAAIDLTYYVDSNGLLYTDSTLETPVIDTALQEESTAASEDDGVMYADLSDSTTPDDYDSAGWPDGVDYATAALVESFDIGIELRVVDYASLSEALEQGYVAVLVDIASLKDVTVEELWHEIEDTLQIAWDVSSHTSIQRIISEVITISEEINANALVVFLVDGVGVGELQSHKRDNDTTQYTAENRTYIQRVKTDFGRRGLKFVDFIEVGATDYEDVYVKVAFRYNQSEDWRYTNWIRVNSDGVAFAGVAGNEFKFALKRETGRIVPTYMTVYWKPLDKRYARTGYVGSEEANS